MKHAFTLVIFLILVLVSTTAVQANKSISICGTGDSQELLRKLAKAYEELHAGSRVNVPDSIGSSGGVKATKAGKCDLGRVARPLTDKEKQYDLSYLLFAYSPVVFLANENMTGVKNLTSQEVVDIFSGKINNWKALGGPEGKIFVANREKGDSSRAVIEKKIPSFAQIEKFIGQTIYTSPETIKTISTYENTIGYGSLAMAKNNISITTFSLDGINPNQKNIKNGSYKLVSPFGLIWRKKPSTQTENFLMFLHTQKAEEIMIAHGTISALSKN